MNKENDWDYSSLLTVPPSDGNFKNSLGTVSAETIEKVLAELPADGTKTKRKVLESRLRRLRRKN